MAFLIQYIIYQESINEFIGENIGYEYGEDNGLFDG